MAKDPAFLFYPGDWIAGTMHLSFEEKGAYMELLMLQFNVGHMTSHMIGRVLGQSMDKIWPCIKNKFEIDSEGLYYNPRLEDEKLKRKSYIASRKNNIKGKNQYNNNKKSTAHMNGHMTSHMENENEDVNNSIIKALEFSKIVISDNEYLDSFTSPPANYIRAMVEIKNGASVFSRHCNKQGVGGRSVKEHKSHLSNWATKRWRDLAPTSKLRYA